MGIRKIKFRIVVFPREEKIEIELRNDTYVSTECVMFYFSKKKNLEMKHFSPKKKKIMRKQLF